MSTSKTEVYIVSRRKLVICSASIEALQLPNVELKACKVYKKVVLSLAHMRDKTCESEGLSPDWKMRSTLNCRIV